MSAQNLTLLTDLYELTMMQGYFETQENETVIFDVFFRDNPNRGGYSIMAGLEQVIEYIKNLNFSYEDVDYLRSLGIFSDDFLHYLSGFHFSGNIYAIPEGSVIFPKEPIVKVYRSDYGGTACGNSHFKYYQPPVPDRHQGVPGCLCRPGQRRHGIRPSPGSGPGCRSLRRKSRHDRRMCGKLPTYWPGKCLTYLCWEPMRTAGL